MPWRPRWTFWVTLFIGKFGWSYNVFLQKQRGRFAFFKLFIFFAILFSTWKIGGGGSNPKRLVFLHKRPQPLARGPEGQGPAAEAEGRHCQDRCNRLGPKRGACWREAPSGSQTGELSLLGRRRGCSDRVNSSILSTSPRGTSPTPAPLSSFLHRRVHSIAAWYIYLFIVGKRNVSSCNYSLVPPRKQMVSTLSSLLVWQGAVTLGLAFLYSQLITAGGRAEPSPPPTPHFQRSIPASPAFTWFFQTGCPRTNFAQATRARAASWPKQT